MKNLKLETLEVLAENGKTEQDVKFVKIRDVKISFENFLKCANFTYDDGYGTNEVDLSITTHGEDFVIYRWEYDGSEWWEYIDLKEPIKEVQEAILKEKERRYYEF